VIQITKNSYDYLWSRSWSRQAMEMSSEDQQGNWQIRIEKQQQMSGRGLSVRLSIPKPSTGYLRQGDAVEEAKLARARAREALTRAEEAFWRAIYRHNAERAVLEALRRNMARLHLPAFGCSFSHSYGRQFMLADDAR
jgi:hypothetical protein